MTALFLWGTIIKNDNEKLLRYLLEETHDSYLLKMFSNITKENKPPYFHDLDYSDSLPLTEKVFSSYNNISSYIPDLHNWIYDQLELHCGAIKKRSHKKRVLTLAQTAREYHSTIKQTDFYSTVVTHMYICELLTKLLVNYFHPEKKFFSHGYDTTPFSPQNSQEKFLEETFGGKSAEELADLNLSLKGAGVAQELHNLFYNTSLGTRGKNLQSMREYFRFLPEIRLEYSEKYPEHPSLCIEKEDGHGETGAHDDRGEDSSYHFVRDKRGDKLQIMYPEKLQDNILFPELRNLYIISKGYANKAVQELDKADELISTTQDVDGASYALGFEGSNIPKQRDIEIRFYVLYILGSLGRYFPEEWSATLKESPHWYYFTRRFLEHNQIIFPLLVLRYITGKRYTFNSNVWA